MAFEPESGFIPPLYHVAFEPESGFIPPLYHVAFEPESGFIPSQSYHVAFEPESGQKIYIPGWPASRKLDNDTRLACEPETGLLFTMLPGWPLSRKLDYYLL